MQQKNFLSTILIAISVFVTAIFSFCSDDEKDPIIENSAPTVVITTPVNNTEFEENQEINFEATATDVEDGEILPNKIVWASNIDGELATGFQFTKTDLSTGNHQIIATATDSKGLLNADTILIAVNQKINLPPTVVINQPENETVYNEGAEINFACTASDVEDQQIENQNIVWTSNIDGELFKGTSFLKSNLSIGLHQIIVTATDSEGLTAKDTTNIEVQIVNIQPNIELMLNWMTGSFSSEAHADTTTNPYIVDVRLHMVRIWPEKPDYWIYVEQAYAESPSTPYRQRIYKVFIENNQLQDEIYVFANSSAYIGSYTSPQDFNNLSESDLTIKEGCNVFFNWNEQNQSFTGATEGHDCLATIPGLPQVKYITSDTEIFETYLTSWDRGYSETGAWLLGPDWPYIFDKLEDYEFDVKKNE